MATLASRAPRWHLKGRGDFANVFLFEIPPGEIHHAAAAVSEEVIYVLEGSGSTQVEFSDGARRSFEIERACSPSLRNAKHRAFNASGTGARACSRYTCRW